LGIIIKKDNLTNKVGRLNKKMGFYLEGVSDCEELVGYCAYDEVHVHYTHACMREDFLLILYISNHNNRDTDRKKKSLHAGRREMLEISFPLLIIW
jgi:hypothetical protein